MMYTKLKWAYVIFGMIGLLMACSASVDDAGTPRKIVRDVTALLDRVAANELATNPELATRLGLKQETAGYDFNAVLTDRSQAAFERGRLQRIETLSVLQKTPRPAAGSALARHLDVIIAAEQTAIDLSRFGHGRASLGLAYPYVADHMRGAYIDVPDLLTRHHPVRSAADARGYVERLRQLPDAIDDEGRRLVADAKSGVVPPDFILNEMLTVVDSFTMTEDGDVKSHPLMTGLYGLLSGPQDLESKERNALADEGLLLLETSVLPAYVRLRETIGELAASAPSQPGVWQLPEGDTYYQAVLEAYTMPGVDVSELHQQGLNDVEGLLAEIDTALTELDMYDGSVGERLALLALEDGQTFSDDSDGRAALKARLDAHLEMARASAPQVFTALPRTPVGVQVVPTYLEPSSAAAMYTAAPANETAPGLFRINLSDMTAWPDFTLATLVFHETIPGHHIESAIAAEHAKLPLMRQMIWNSAYGEGWGVYSEDLADEMGLYDNDPMGRIGYLQSLLLRASRLVVDTGIHHQQWTREQAVDYLVSTTGQSQAAMRREVDRYSVWPGQAASYWVGRQHIRDLRQRAQRVLGPDFDLMAFHDAVLTGGPRPLMILQADIERWYGAQIETD